MRLLPILVLALTGFACSSNTTGGTGNFITEFPPDPLDAIDPTPEASCTGTWAVGGRGQIIDEQGNPVARARAQMCLRSPTDTLLCVMPPESGADGFWHQEVPEGEPRCVAEMALRALLPNAGFGTTYCHVPLTTNGAVVELREPIVLYATTPAISIPPVGDANAARTVVMADGLEMDVVPSVFFGEDYQNLAARRVDHTDPPCFTDDSLDGLYVFSPEVSVLGETGGVPIRIPADGMAEGTRVELLVLGGLETRLADGSAVEEADFVRFGTGTVTGGMIVADPGSELPYLSWLGYRRI